MTCNIEKCNGGSRLWHPAGKQTCPPESSVFVFSEYQMLVVQDDRGFPERGRSDQRRVLLAPIARNMVEKHCTASIQGSDLSKGNFSCQPYVGV